MFDSIVIGAGFAGSVVAERLASQKNHKVLVVEKEKHIGGHCYDYRNELGIIIHKYGPHLFHTDSKLVWDYLSQFTEWDYYQHHVLAFIDGKNVPLPFSFSTMEMLFPTETARRIEDKLLQLYTYNQRVPIMELLKQNDPDIRFISEYIYEKVFKNYTIKQWKLKLNEIDSAVSARVPILVGYDTRYFTDTYQAVPKYGYTKLFENLLNHPNIKLLLGTSFSEIAEIKDDKIYVDGKLFKGIVYFTGMLDELFGYDEGELPYRSLKLEFKTLSQEYYQNCATINYPNNYAFTRITEFKHIHKIKNNGTTILIEYPLRYKKDENRAYYPIFTEDSKKMYGKYLAKATKIKNLVPIGRLAEYKYYDMDDVVEKALAEVMN